MNLNKTVRAKIVWDLDQLKKVIKFSLSAQLNSPQFNWRKFSRFKFSIQDSNFQFKRFRFWIQDSNFRSHLNSRLQSSSQSLKLKYDNYYNYNHNIIIIIYNHIIWALRNLSENAIYNIKIKKIFSNKTLWSDKRYLVIKKICSDKSYLEIKRYLAMTSYIAMKSYLEKW